MNMKFADFILRRSIAALKKNNLEKTLLTSFGLR